MEPVDPFPAFPFTKARTQLRLYFGEAAVQWDDPVGDVVIHLRRPLRPPRSLRLTWCQAKYLALDPKAWTAIIRGNTPTTGLCKRQMQVRWECFPQEPCLAEDAHQDLRIDFRLLTRLQTNCVQSVDATHPNKTNKRLKLWMAGSYTRWINWRV